MNTTTDLKPTEPDVRDLARERIQARRDLGSHVAAYVVVNGAMIGVWAMTGRGYFWPAWVLVMWAAGLLLHAWDVVWRRPVSDTDIDRELGRR